MDKHDLISKLKDMAIELGRIPTRNEFCKGVKAARYHITKHYQEYSVMVHAAGLDPNRTTKAVSNIIFEKSIEEQIEGFIPKVKHPFIETEFTSSIIIGDTHFPFVHKEKIKKVLEFIDFVKPARVIQIGDLYDMLSHTKFPRSMNVYTPKEEMDLARAGAREMWKKIRMSVPKAEMYQILGNHDIRPMKRILERYPEGELFLDFEKWFLFDGVQAEMDTRKELILDGIAYIHGHGSKLGQHMEYMRRSVIHGHTHRAGIVYKNYGDTILFEADAGFVGDMESKALSYTPQKYTHSTHTILQINQFGPQIIIL